MNICANFDILFYLSHPRNKYAEQTLFEINTMLYLAELLSIYGRIQHYKMGIWICTKQIWCSRKC